MLKELDRIKDIIKLKIIAQIGHSTYEPSFFFKKTFHKQNHMKLMKNLTLLKDLHQEMHQMKILDQN